MAPLAVEHGPVWQVSTHQWAPASGAAPPVLNDVRELTRVYPEIAIDGVTGWRSSPELEDRRAPRTSAATPGEVPYPSRVLGKPLIYEGRIVANDANGSGLLTLLEAQNEFIQGFSTSMDDEGTMTVTPWVAPFGGVVWTYTARVLAWDFDPNWDFNEDGSIVEWGFRLSLRMSDPRFFTGGNGYW